MVLGKWTWMVCEESKICFDCAHMESEGWTIVSIVLTNPNFTYYKVFMRRDVE